MKKIFVPRVIALVSLLLFVATLALYIRELKLNEGYYNYEKQSMRNDLVGYADALLLADQILYNAALSGAISIGNLESLSDDFNKQTNSFENMARREQIQNKSLDEVTAVASESMGLYINNKILYPSIGNVNPGSLNQNTKISLNDTQKDTLKKIEAINDKWVTIVKKHITVISGTLVGDSFTKVYDHTNYTHWYSMANELESYSSTLDLNFIHSLSSTSSAAS